VWLLFLYMNTETTITGLPLASAIDPAVDWFAVDRTSLNTTQRINRNTMLGITGSPVGTSDSQTLTNKIITSPTLTVLDNAFTLQDNVDPTKQAQFQLSGISTTTTRTYTLPNASGTIADIASAQTLTNKTLTSPVITGGSIDNSTVTVDSIAGHTTANSGTVYGASITAGVIASAALANAVNTAAIQNLAVTSGKIADSAVTPAKLFTGTGSTWVWQSWAPTWTGFSASPTTSAYYTIIGKTVILLVRCTANGTSNATTMTITNAPITSRTISGMFWGSTPWQATNNGSVSSATSRAYIGSNSNTITLGLAGNDSGWTNANGKAIDFTLIYEAA